MKVSGLKLRLLFLGMVGSLLVGMAGCTTAKVQAPLALNVSYATGFTIQNLGGGVDKITDGEKQTLLLVPTGKTVPAGYETATLVRTPVQRAVILSVTFGALMRPLGVLNSLVGIGTVQDELYLDELKALYTSGQVKYVGGGGMGAPDFEAIQALKPDVVFMSTGLPDWQGYYTKLKGLGITVAVCNDFLENDPLARLEWIKFIGTFYGKDAQADTYFKAAEAKVNGIAAKTATATSKPGVLWASIFMGSVYASGSDSYVAKWISQAGGNYLFSDIKGTSAATISIEELYAKGKDAGVFIYASTPPYINSIAEILQNGAILGEMQVIKDGKVYCMQPWFYQIADKPDEIVQDLAYIFHPDLFPGYVVKDFMVLPAK